MAEYINRIDAINALCGDSADESMSVYLDKLYGRLMAIKAEDVIRLSYAMSIVARMMQRYPSHVDVLARCVIELADLGKEEHDESV